MPVEGEQKVGEEEGKQKVGRGCSMWARVGAAGAVPVDRVDPGEVSSGAGNGARIGALTGGLRSGDGGGRGEEQGEGNPAWITRWSERESGGGWGDLETNEGMRHRSVRRRCGGAFAQFFCAHAIAWSNPFQPQRLLADSERAVEGRPLPAF